MIASRKLALAFLTSLLLLGMAGCDNDTDAEEVGEQIDEKFNDVGNAVEDACEEVKEEAGAEDQDC
ncbi:hypothetical protein [Microbulbifer yueqingensis]|uniref:Uncharacterized protein n=1 Tax=Microbulbifer yueqingensis TaxID=658219 RepID=A0A1G8XWM5_9GAMM|nr:hypothetical protein [Microbulbifer yueqingensis]SDJ94180.1 hypothetical protein SAMN05216212_1244 [Microbulbifer yueqingensis]